MASIDTKVIIANEQIPTLQETRRDGLMAQVLIPQVIAPQSGTPHYVQPEVTQSRPAQITMNQQASQTATDLHRELGL